jgi:hypothetical protein
MPLNTALFRRLSALWQRGNLTKKYLQNNSLQIQL